MILLFALSDCTLNIVPEQCHMQQTKERQTKRTRDSPCQFGSTDRSIVRSTTRIYECNRGRHYVMWQREAPAAPRSTPNLTGMSHCTLSGRTNAPAIAINPASSKNKETLGSLVLVTHHGSRLPKQEVGFERKRDNAHDVFQ